MSQDDDGHRGKLLGNRMEAIPRIVSIGHAELDVRLTVRSFEQNAIVPCNEHRSSEGPAVDQGSEVAIDAIIQSISPSDSRLRALWRSIPELTLERRSAPRSSSRRMRS